MTKARDLANIISGGFTVSDLPTLTATEIPNLDAAKITTGTLANARISEASVTQHVAATDLSGVNADITALALREATNESSAAFNLPNQFIETFTDDTNLGTQTTGDRTSGYWSSSTTATGSADGDWSDVWTLIQTSPTVNNTVDQSGSGSEVAPTIVGTSVASGITSSTSNPKWGTHSIDFASGRNSDNKLHIGSHIANFKDLSNLWTVEMWVYQTSRNADNVVPDYSDTGLWRVGGTYAAINVGSGGRMQYYDYSTAPAARSQEWNSSYSLPLNTWTHLAFVFGGSYVKFWAAGVYIGSVNRIALNTACPAECDFGTSNTSEDSARFIGQMDDIRMTDKERYTGTGSITVPTSGFYPNNDVITVNATGTLIQSANTVASAKTKVGGTMLYKDNFGTATLGTDLKIYFTCNGGSNWTEVTSFEAITPVYSTGIKQVRLGEKTCTSGTDVRYKAVWANQAASSKETQLHGIGLNY